MWCDTCQQDVPAVAADGQTGVCCVRCREPLVGGGSGSPEAASGPNGAQRAISSTMAVGAAWRPPGDLYDWELAQTLRHVGHVLKRSAPKKPQASGSERALRRLDASHQGVGHWHARPVTSTTAPAPHDRVFSERAKHRTSPLAWNITLVGLAAFSCGVSLLIVKTRAGKRPRETPEPSCPLFPFAFFLVP